jgi:DNA-binding NtrC family response regulator
MLPCVLIVDDEGNTRDTMIQLFDSEYEAFGTSNYAEVTNLLKNECSDVVLTDLGIQDKDGMFILDEVSKLPRKPVCIMMSAYGNIETAVEVLKHGAFDFVMKPINFDSLNVLIKCAINSRNPVKEAKFAAQNRPEEAIPIVGLFECLVAILDLIKKNCSNQSQCPVRGRNRYREETLCQSRPWVQ